MRREIYRSQWEKEFFEAQEKKDGSTSKLIGSSPGGAAAELRVTRQRIHQLVNEEIKKIIWKSHPK